MIWNSTPPKLCLATPPIKWKCLVSMYTTAPPSNFPCNQPVRQSNPNPHIRPPPHILNPPLTPPIPSHQIYPLNCLLCPFCIHCCGLIYMKPQPCPYVWLWIHSVAAMGFAECSFARIVTTTLKCAFCEVCFNFIFQFCELLSQILIRNILLRVNKVFNFSSE